MLHRITMRITYDNMYKVISPCWCLVNTQSFCSILFPNDAHSNQKQPYFSHTGSQSVHYLLIYRMPIMSCSPLSIALEASSGCGMFSVDFCRSPTTWHPLSHEKHSVNIEGINISLLWEQIGRETFLKSSLFTSLYEEKGFKKLTKTFEMGEGSH